nr:putative nuclease HARBI1 isoform X2 [Aedes albopictus]
MSNPGGNLLHGVVQAAVQVVSSYLMCASSSSSSSESDSDDPVFEDLMFKACGRKDRQKRHRVENFVEDVVAKYSDEEFRRNFRLKRSTAEHLVSRYEGSEFYVANAGVGRKNVPAKQQMLSFLWFCANKNSYREIANMFNMCEATYFRCLENILNFFCDISSIVIRFPESEEEKQQVAAGFKGIAGIDNVIGAIDGCYISIRKPANKIRSTYINRHDMVSITLQGICDSKRRFID